MKLKRYYHNYFYFDISILFLILTGLGDLTFKFIFPYHKLISFLKHYFYQLPSYFNKQYYHFMYLKMLVIGIIFIIFSFFLFLNRKKYSNIFTHFIFALWKKFIYFLKKIFLILKSENTNTKWLLFFIILIGIVIRIPYINQPIRFDEAFSFIHFASKPYYIALSFYESPNNHLLYTFFQRLSYLIFGNSLWSLRLPALIFGIFLIFFSFFLGKKFYNSFVGILLSAFISFSFPFIFYSVNSRGYTLFLLLFVLSLIIAKIIIDNPKDKYNWILLSIFGALGTYTIPTMGIFFIAILLWIYISIKNKKIILLSIGTYGIITIFLYIPVIIVSGFQSLLFNHFLHANYWHLSQIGNFLTKLYSLWFKSYGNILLGIFLITVSSLCYLNKKYRLYKKPILPAFLIVIILYFLINPYTGPVRTWLPILILFFLFVGVGFFAIYNYFKQKNQHFIIIILIIFIFTFSIFRIINNNYIIKSEETGTFPNAKEITNTFKNMIGNHDLIFNDYFSTDILKYYFLREHISLSPFYFNKNKRICRYFVVLKNDENVYQVLKLNSEFDGIKIKNGIINGQYYMELFRKFSHSSIFIIRKFRKHVEK